MPAWGSHLLISSRCDLLQKVCYTFALRAYKASTLKELRHPFPWTMVHQIALRYQHDIIKQIICLRGRLQQSNACGGLHKVGQVPQVLHNGVRGAAVQTSGDFIHEQNTFWSHNHLASCDTLLLSACYRAQDMSSRVTKRMLYGAVS